MQRFSLVVTFDANSAPQLSRTLDSLFNEAGQDAEVLLVGPHQLLPEKRPSFRRLRSVDYAGHQPAAAANAGFRVAGQDIVGWLQAGEHYYCDALREVAEVFDRSPSTDVVYGDACCVDDRGEFLGAARAMAWCPRRLMRRCLLCRPSVFWRRGLFDRIGMPDASLLFWSDYEYWLRLSGAGANVVQIPSLLASWRLAAGPGTTYRPLRDTLPEAMRELMQVFASRGHVPLRWTLQYGRAVSDEAGPSTTVAPPRFARTIAGALGAEREWNRRTWSLPLAAAGLGIEHASQSLKQHPSPAAWMSFGPVGRFVRRHWHRKLFRLRNYEPRPLKTPQHYHETVPPVNAPRISIVTPNFNLGNCLGDTICSVLGQNYPSLEYIIQDGGSTDESVEIIRRYASHLAHWESAPDGGQTHALNLGMQRTTGEIMAYLNSDDMLLPGSLAYVAGYFRDHPDVDVVYGHRVLIDDRGRDIGRWVLPRHDQGVLSWSDYIPQETMFWRRRAWDTVGGRFDESFGFAMDWDLILRFCEAGLKFTRLPRFLGAFRVCEQQKTTRLMATLGRREMERLRRRVLGSVPSRRAVRHALRPYLRRQWVIDKLHDLGFAR